MTTEQKINEFIANQEKALADFKDNLLKEINPKQEFEVGDYVRWTGFSPVVGKITKVAFEKDCFGLSLDFSNTTSLSHDSCHISHLKKLTEAEVKEALEKEWEKRGGVLGAVFYSVTANGCKGKVENRPMKYYPDEDRLSYITGGMGDVYKQGKWAEIVKDSPIKIGGRFKVGFERCNASASFNFLAKIDGHEFGGHFWEGALKVAQHTKGAVWVGCDSKGSGSNKWPVDKETIEKILTECKKPVH